MKKEGRLMSHGLTYRYVRTNESGGLAGHCRHGMKYGRLNRTAKAGSTPGRTGIHDRPEEANSRRFDDWEMDTMAGKNGKGAILTPTERPTNFILMEKPEHMSNFSAMYTVIGQSTSSPWRNPDTAERPHTRREPQSGCRCRTYETG